MPKKTEPSYDLYSLSYKGKPNTKNREVILQASCTQLTQSQQNWTFYCRVAHLKKKFPKNEDLQISKGWLNCELAIIKIIIFALFEFNILFHLNLCELYLKHDTNWRKVTH